MAELQEFYAVCSAGFEKIVAKELKNLNVERIRPLQGGVAFFGSIEEGLRANLWLRCASRVLLVLARVDASDADQLYESTREIFWQDHIKRDASIAVSARGTNAALRNTQFVALRVKDAICDELRARTGQRPEVKKHRPDVHIAVTLHAKKATIALDLSGEPLHRRGYRLEGKTVAAPLKETLAAGLLLSSSWADMVEDVHSANLASAECLLYDPFCGSGTIVIEAAMMAADMAPGLLRDYWGFSGWKQFDQDVFDDLLAEADDRLEVGLSRMPRLCASDLDPQAIDVARASAARAGLAQYISFEVADCADMDRVLSKPGIREIGHGLIVGNPPYGVRLMNGNLDEFYLSLQKGLVKVPTTWQFVAISPDQFFDDALGMQAETVKEVYNGALKTSIRSYQLEKIEARTLSLVTLSGTEVEIPILSDHPEQFAARLRKNAKKRRKWAKEQHLCAFRLYDADLPDYAVSIDLYLVCEEVNARKEQRSFKVPYGVISEYQAPRSIDPHKAYRRFVDALRITSALLEIPQDHLFTRLRKQERGGMQYAFENRSAKRVLTQESGLVFELDLARYLDVGLFLDHRITRRFIAAQAKGKDVLNLFAYTGSASVYALAGGAKSVTTVDLSQTYLDWARRNMIHNGFGNAHNRLIKADVREWIRSEKDPRQARQGRIRRYDLIFIDPPTFSNSKAMGKRTWDIQRDHFYLLRDASKLLREGGTIIFSGNLRSFKLDEKGMDDLGFDVLDITEKTIPEDFTRNKKIHFCYVLQKRS